MSTSDALKALPPPPRRTLARSLQGAGSAGQPPTEQDYVGTAPGKGVRTGSRLRSVACPAAPPAYTDTGFLLLAALIIEALTGRPLHEAYRDLVLDPAGMADTWLESSSEAPRRRDIAAHDLEGRDITDMDPTVDWAGGGLVSTAEDLAAFLRALTTGRLLSTPGGAR
jgi:CubicO group peptidase (beta-lactamase class C family)